MMRHVHWIVNLLLALHVLAMGCGKSGFNNSRSSASGVVFSIVSGSENEPIEPIVKRFADQQGATIDMKYLGSVDISSELEKGKNTAYDAVWPAASIWISLGDSGNVAKHRRSIMRSPVVFAVKSSVAKSLGWTNKPDITVSQILEGVEAQGLRFAMTSATQSNSGASWYLGCLSAFSGQPEVLSAEILDKDEVRTQIRRFLSSVNRSSGSSGWLKDMVVQNYNRYDGMVNYECLVIEANRELQAKGEEPLYAIYPVDGLTVADSPLAYVDKGDSGKEKFFHQLQEYLLSSDVQQEIARTGRRTGLLGSNQRTDTNTFNPAWGIDSDRVLSPIQMPSSDVLRKALNLYQVAFRKPSLTAFVLDFSGSMEGTGEQELKEAMFTLLDEKESSRYLLQPSKDDVTFVIPFNSAVIAVWKAEGNDPTELRKLLRTIEQQSSGGGTDMYAGTLAAMRQVAELDKTGKYHTAIILMSDGVSQGNFADLQSIVERERLSRDTPIFTILFGEADPSQMQPVAEWSGGRMFDGRQDVIKAFRQAKGYN
jgi:Ca-activated chloride channel family protein